MTLCVPVDGIWLSWGSWGPCSQTCDQGVMTRSRTCSPPLYGGLDCQGNNTDVTTCIITPCPCEFSERGICCSSLQIYFHVQLFMIVTMLMAFVSYCVFCFLTKFGHLFVFVKSRLFHYHCNFFFGCELSSLLHNLLDEFQGLPHTKHNFLIPVFVNDVNFLHNILHNTFINFANKLYVI